MAFLPGTPQDRIRELREKEGWTRKQLAEMIGVSPSTIGRIESGKTKGVSDETLQPLARVFRVSTDFLTGITDVPDRKNYDIGELGLSAQAARNLYTGKVNAEVVNRMLAHGHFGQLTQLIAHYFSDIGAVALAAQNQMFSALSSMTRGYGKENPEKAQAVKEVAPLVAFSKTPVYQADLTRIETLFMAMVKDIKKDMASGRNTPEAASKEVTEQLIADLAKGQEAPDLPTITPEQIVTAITDVAALSGPVSPAQRDALYGALLPFFQAKQQEVYDENADE